MKGLITFNRILKIVTVTILMVLIAASIALSGENQKVAEQTPDISQVEKPKPDSRYLIGKGDVLFISVWRDEVLTNTVVVLPDGTIAFPLVGEILAVGKTVAELKTELEAKIQHYIPSPTLSVMVQQVTSMQIYIIGKVNRPGSYPLNTNLNVLQALSIAGGLNSFANRKQIKIFRNDGDDTKIIRFNYKEVTQGEELDQNINLKRGDIIVVP